MMDQCRWCDTDFSGLDLAARLNHVQADHPQEHASVILRPQMPRAIMGGAPATGDTFKIVAAVLKPTLVVNTDTPPPYVVAEVGGAWVTAYRCTKCGLTRLEQGSGRVYQCPECGDVQVNPETTRSECCGKFMRRLNPGKEEAYCLACEEDGNLTEESMEVEQVEVLLCSSCSLYIDPEQIGGDNGEYAELLRCALGDYSHDDGITILE